MSLESLRQLRRQGGKPTGIVKVVIGRSHPVIDGAPDVIAIDRNAQPHHMDWRAIVGLPVALFVCDGASALGEQVFDSVLDAGGKLLGAAWSDVTLAPVATQPVLHRMWGVLCN